MTSTYEREHSLIRRLFAEALKAVEPRRVVRASIRLDGDGLIVDGQRVPLNGDGRLIVLAIGKAAPAMAQGALDVLGDRIDRGIILTKHGHLTGTIEPYVAYEAGHPVPDDDGASATRAVLDMVGDLTGADVVIALISGGGSALLEVPREPLSLEDMQETTRLLLHAGATIHELNAVRSVLSQVKGGGLRHRIGPARCVSLLLSDVLGNDPAIIASGPTIPTPASPARAREVVRRFGLEERLPTRVRGLLDADVRASMPASIGQDDVWAVIADNAALVAEMNRLLGDEGLTTTVAWEAWENDAGDLGRRLVTDALSAPHPVDVLLGGGEATVEVTGDGVGGRNTEAALVAAIELERIRTQWVVASLASDGQDGASDAAGAIADPETCSRARAAGISPSAALANNDSATLFELSGGLVVTGPSGTNVNDVYLAMRIREAKQQ